MTLTPLGRFPSIASFLSRQSVHKKGPCHGFRLVEKIEPAWTDMPSLGAKSSWHIAHVNIPPPPPPPPPVVGSLEQSPDPNLQENQHKHLLRDHAQVFEGE